eukprot:scaffold24036_cov46-Prasinocladus_malaysianus.AAC.1
MLPIIVIGASSSGAGGPSMARLLSMARTTAAVLHARTTCDVSIPGELLTLSLTKIMATPSGEN